MTAYIEVRSNVGFADGEFAIAIINVHTRQATIPPLAFRTRQDAEGVVDAIVAGNPQLYTRDRSWLDRGDDW